MMLLMGMKMSLTKKPTNPITTKPMAVRTATFENSTNHQKKKKKAHRKIQIHSTGNSNQELINKKGGENEDLRGIGIRVRDLCGQVYGIA